MNIMKIVLRYAMLPIRLHTALSYYWHHLANIGHWLFSSREHTNFTYNLTDLNLRYLACFLGQVCAKPPEMMRDYLREVLDDKNLREHVAKLTRMSERSYLADDEPRYARRIGWYAIVRATKPAVVVETGVDKGLGSCVLASALMKNSEEGHPGYLYGTDINPKAGYLLQAPYNRFGKVLYGDSIESLNRFEEKIDLFINDSDHSTDYEIHEYETVAEKLSPKAMIVGDNSHFSDKLVTFAERTNRDFLFFQEQPENHWYPGGGIGIAFSRA